MDLLPASQQAITSANVDTLFDPKEHLCNDKWKDKNRERHTAHTIVLWPNPTQRQIVHNSDSMMMGWRTRILTINTKKRTSWMYTAPYIVWQIIEITDLILDTHSTEMCLTVEYFQIRLNNDDHRVVWCANIFSCHTFSFNKMHLKCHLLSVDHFVHALMREITVIRTDWMAATL